MKNKFIAVLLVVFIWGALASGLGWIIKKDITAIKNKPVLIDSFKIDSITIKIYKDGRSD